MAGAATAAADAGGPAALAGVRARRSVLPENGYVVDAGAVRLYRLPEVVRGRVFDLARSGRRDELIAEDVPSAREHSRVH